MLMIIQIREIITLMRAFVGAVLNNIGNNDNRGGNGNMNNPETISIAMRVVQVLM